MSAEVKAKWEAMQIKTFTNWCNMHLSKRGESISSLTEDFRASLLNGNLMTAWTGICWITRPIRRCSGT